jgi:hypothetical protein
MGKYLRVMDSLLAAAAWCGMIAVLVFRAASQGRLYASTALEAPAARSDDESLPFVTAVVPARNERENIGRCLCEDSALARAVKGAGFHIGFAGAERFVRTRMYGDVRSLFAGMGKNVIESLGGAERSAMAVGIALCLGLGAVGVPLAVSHAEAACVLAAVGSTVLAAMHVRAASYFRIPLWYGLLFPWAIFWVFAWSSTGRACAYGAPSVGRAVSTPRLEAHCL